MARVFKDTPKRFLRRDLTTGREHGDSLKYRVLQKVLDRLTAPQLRRWSSGCRATPTRTRNSSSRCCFTRMCDNVLILTEEHVSPNLAELSSYFSGCLRLDGRDFRTRLLRVVEWYASELQRDPELARLASASRALDAPTTRAPTSIAAGYSPSSPPATAFDCRAAVAVVRAGLGEPAGEAQGVRAASTPLRRSIVLCEREADALLGKVRTARARYRRARSGRGSRPARVRSTSWRPGWSTRWSPASA